MKALVAVVFFVILTAADVRAAGYSFPTNGEAKSPDAERSVRCSSSKASDGSYLHRLSLWRGGRLDRRTLFEFDRSCDVLWSPDSKQIALTNWAGSSLSEIILLEVVRATARRLEIANLREFISEEEQGGHCYYEAEEWEFQNKLRVRVFGHTDEAVSHAFSRTLSVETSSGWAVLLKRSDREDGK